MKKQILYPLLSLILIGAIIGSCKHQIPTVPPDNPVLLGDTSTGGSGTPCDTSLVYFQQQVLPILVSNCALSGCHDVTSHRDGRVYTTYNYTMTTGGVTPGNPSRSKVYTALSDGMPPNGHTPLTAAQKNLIYKWIQQGAKDLVCTSACGDTVNITFTNSVKPIITNKCQGCHSGTAPSGSIDLSTYANIKTQVTNGKLWGSVSHSTGYIAMPVGGTLSTCELTQIRKWIANGSPNN